MEKQEYVINIGKENSNLLQKKQYEFNAKSSIISFLALDEIIDWDVMQQEITEAEVASVELDLVKSLVSHNAIKSSNYDIDSNYFKWQLDYYDYNITFVQDTRIPEIISKEVFDVEEDDIKELEKAQYEYNAACSILSVMKINVDTNKEIVSEYNKVCVERKIKLDRLKDDIAHKYNKANFDLDKYNWSIDFIDKTITFKEVKR